MYRIRARQNITARAQTFSRPTLLTLTVDPEQFGNDPLTAYLTIKKKRYVAELLSQLHITRWICVMEISQAGWPHWHVLIDCPRGRIDFDKAWAIWGGKRTRDRIGGLHCNPQEAKPAADTVCTIAAYVTKVPADPLPDWLLDLPARVRWISSSRRVGALVKNPEPAAAQKVKRKSPASTTHKAPRPVTTIRTREAACGMTVNFIRKFYGKQDGDAVFRFCGQMDVTVFDWACENGFMECTQDDWGQLIVADVQYFAAHLDTVTDVVRSIWMEESQPPASLPQPPPPPSSMPTIEAPWFAVL